jgi:hypothetical protein
MGRMPPIDGHADRNSAELLRASHALLDKPLPLQALKGKSDRFTSDEQAVVSKVLVAGIRFVDIAGMAEVDAQDATLAVSIYPLEFRREREGRGVVNPLLDAHNLPLAASQPVVEAKPIARAGVNIVCVSQANDRCDRFNCRQCHDPRRNGWRQDDSQECRRDVEIVHVTSYIVD